LTRALSPSAGASYAYGSPSVSLTSSPNSELIDYTGGSNPAYTYTISVAVSGAGEQALIGNGIAYSGTTTISQGTLELSNCTQFATNLGNTDTNTTTVAIANSGTLQLDATVNWNLPAATISASKPLVISGSGTIVKTGTATVTIGGNSGDTDTMTGQIIVNAGVLAFATTGSVPTKSGDITINYGGVVAGGVNTIGGWKSNIATSSAGVLALSGTDSESVGMGSLTSLVIGASGAATFNGSFTPAGTTYNLGGGGGALTFATALTGGNSLVAFGGGTGGTLILTGNNSYTGSTTIGSGGTLQAGGANALPSGGAMSVAGVLDLHGNNAIVSALSGTGTVDSLSGGFPALAVGANNASSTFNGAIQNSTGAVALTKTGAGTLLLTGNNTFSGNTTINAGGLAVNGSLLNGGTVIVNGGLAGTLSGAGTVGNVQVWGNGAAISPGYSGVGTVLTASSVSLLSGSVLNYTLGSVGAAGNSFLNIGAGGLAISSSITVNVTPASGWGNGTYELASYTGTLNDTSTGFTGWTVVGGGSHNYSFTDSSGSLDMVVTAAVTTVAGTWNANSGGSWSTAGSWANSLVPTTTGDTALFGPVVTSGTATITLDGSHTLSGLTFNNTAGSYNITTGTGGNLTLVATSGAVPLANNGGSHTISASVALGSNLAVTTTGGSSLTISGPVTQLNAGTSLSLGGSGTLVLSGSDSYSGGTTVTGGTLDLTSSKALPTAGVLVVGRSGRVVLGNITGAAELLAASPLTSESISLASTPAVSSIDSSAAVQVSSPAVQMSVPTVAPVSGGPAAVPEPGTVLLLLVGAAALAVWRLRRS
jgi:autotransporter-associated beta strand protein